MTRVKVCSDYTNEEATRLFPWSSTIYRPTRTLRVPLCFRRDTFWLHESWRFIRMLSVCTCNELRLYHIRHCVGDVEFSPYIETVSTLQQMNRWLLRACSQGFFGASLISHHLFKLRLEELKDFTEVVDTGLRNLSRSLEQRVDGVELSGTLENWLKHETFREKYETVPSY